MELSTFKEIADNRKLRSVIESIVRDQENLRLSTPLLSGRTIFISVSSLALAIFATGAAILPAGAALVPTAASALFLYSSVAESTGARAKGLARYNSAKALGLAAQQETVLAEAETFKAFIPFGVGLTAVFAAACVTLKLYSERVLVQSPFIRSEFSEFVENYCLILAAATVAVATVTNDQALCMRTALTLDRKDRSDDTQSEWESRRLPTVQRTPSRTTRFLVALGSFLICLIPLALKGFSEGIDTWRHKVELDEVAVFVSATAAAQAAFFLLVVEKDFADAERRVAIQAKQAALSELFYAQAMAESAIIAPGTAASGAAFGSASLLVECSKVLAALSIWPAVLSTFRSTASAAMARVEADASFLELQVSRKGRGERKQSDAISSTIREIQRIQSDFQLDTFSNEVRGTLDALPVGDVREFRILDRDRRRKVHMVAAELGMVSQSAGGTTTRTVWVRNLGVRKDEFGTDSGFLQDVVAQWQEEWNGVLSQGIPKDSEPVAVAASVLVLASVSSPFVVDGKAVAELLLPIVTGSIALLTILQERIGKEAVARAKQESAKLLNTQSQAEALLGRGIMAYAALPTDFALATFATTASLVCFVAPQGKWVFFLAPSLLLCAFVACLLAIRRHSRLERYVDRAIKLVDGRFPLASPIFERRSWLLPLLAACLTPCDFPRRITMACAVFLAEVGLVMAVASVQLAAAGFFVARCSRTAAGADAWTQRAQTDIRALPLESATAVLSTLLATAFVTFSLPATAVFPVLGLAVWVRALQFGTRACIDAAEVRDECKSMQELRRFEPWRLQEGAPVGREQKAASTKRRLESPLPPTPVLQSAIEAAASTLRERAIKRRSRPMRSFSQAMQRFVMFWDDRRPEDFYAPSPEQCAVQSVQADLDEIRVSVRTYEKNWFRTLSAIGLCAGAAFLAPFVLSAVATEVVLPVAGAGLTLFAVAAESDARRNVATSKVWGAELGAVVGTMEEMLSAAAFHRARLIGMSGVAACLAIMGLVAEQHWTFGSRWLGPNLAALQAGWQLTLVTVSVVTAAWSALPLQKVWHWADRSKRITVTSLRELRLNDDIEGEPPSKLAARASSLKASFQDLLAGPRYLPFLLMAPALLLAFFPRGVPFGKRVVASTAAGAFIVAGALFFAERSMMRSEIALAGRMRSFALTDALANEAEQQGALLPAASAASIAISGFIAFGTELNPYAASALAILQAMTWVVASRKALATKFESDAALQVASVTEQQSSSSAMDPVLGAAIGRTRDAWVKRIKRYVLRVPM